MLKLFIITSMLLVLVMVGCGKKSGIEGKVLDGKGMPKVGVRVVAKQVQPLKNYEEFSCLTKKDGGFKFDKLYPNSDYELTINPGTSIVYRQIITESGPEGQTKILKEPIYYINFEFPKDKTTALESGTGLMWAANGNIAGKGMTWNDADIWVKQLDYGGYRDWRLPSREELERLVYQGGNNPASWLNLIGFYDIQAHDYWVSNPVVSLPHHSEFVAMDKGKFNITNKTYKLYVLPVRAGEKSNP